MVLPRTGQDRYGKWSAKYDPDVVKTRFTEVKDVASARAQVGLMAVADVQATVSKVLNQYGVLGGLRATYIAFGERVWKMAQRFDGVALQTAISGLIAYFSTAFGANVNILKAIVQALGLPVPSY